MLIIQITSLGEVSYNGGSSVTITITPGQLTFKETANVLKQNLNSSISAASGSFNVIPTNNTFYYTISADLTISPLILQTVLKIY